jgi:hypothetical protein
LISTKQKRITQQQKKKLNWNFPSQVDSQAKSATGFLIDPAQDIEFCLTIFENQRWWMGLDVSLLHGKPLINLLLNLNT